jgi:hypothetical protein
MKFLGWFIAAAWFCVHLAAFSECLNFLESPILEPIGKVLSRFAEGARREKDVIPRSRVVNLDENCKIVKIGLYFDSYNHLALPQARSLILSIADGLFNNLNASPDAPSIFAVYPIPIENLDVRIRFLSRSDDYTWPKIGNIALISLTDGKLSYGTLNSHNFRIEHLRIEDFAQAQLLDERR